jgi:2-keto-4-pentenoate hydratase/2-oxohepta-3-ene-1,7-dioic acid hydratase in catechol pathway
MLELGDKPVEKPVIFLKPPSVLKQASNWGETVLAALTEEDTHYECEIVLRINADGYRLSISEAENIIDCYTVGLDMTLRGKQAQLKKDGHPWEVSKVFPDSAIIGPWIAKENNVFYEVPFQFMLDGVVRQNASGADMLFRPAQLVNLASHSFHLRKGDVLFTGTPAGVGSVNKNSVGALIIKGKQFNIKWSS